MAYLSFSSRTDCERENDLFGQFVERNTHVLLICSLNNSSLPCTNIVAFSTGKSRCNFPAKSDREDCICRALARQSHVHENRQLYEEVVFGPKQSVRIAIVPGSKTLPLPPRTIVPTMMLHRFLCMLLPTSGD